MMALILKYGGRSLLRACFSIFLLLAAVTGLTGCSNPRDANKKNFTEAINKAIADSIFIGLDEMPVSEFNGGRGGHRLAKIEQRFETGDHYLKVPKLLFGDRKRELLLDDLTKKGIVIPWMNAFYTGQGLFDFPNDVYLFKSAKLRYAKPVRSGGSLVYAFYCGKPAVERIIEWTEPGDSNGMKITSVKYKARLDEVPDWSSSLKKYYDESLQNDKEAMLVLTNNGWSMK
jgi:hypothetical protein